MKFEPVTATVPEHLGEAVVTSFVNVGPLTTALALPTGCVTREGFSAFRGSWNAVAHLIPFDHWFPCSARHGMWDVDPSCRPPATPVQASSPVVTDTTVTSKSPSNTETALIYSPGIICPAGWTAAFSQTGSLPSSRRVKPGDVLATSLGSAHGSQWRIGLQERLEPDDSMILCCPK